MQGLTCALDDGFDRSGVTLKGNESESTIRTRGYDWPLSTGPPPSTTTTTHPPPPFLSHLVLCMGILVCFASFVFVFFFTVNDSQLNLACFCTYDSWQRWGSFLFLRLPSHDPFLHASSPHPFFLVCDQGVEPLGSSVIGKTLLTHSQQTHTHTHFIGGDSSQHGPFRPTAHQSQTGMRVCVFVRLCLRTH